MLWDALWKSKLSKDSTVELARSFALMLVPGIELRPPGSCSKLLSPAAESGLLSEPVVTSTALTLTVSHTQAGTDCVETRNSVKLERGGWVGGWVIDTYEGGNGAVCIFPFMNSSNLSR